MNNFFVDKKILITGGAGFIGSNLCEYFLNKGCKVRCFDDFSTGKMKNIEEIHSHKNFELIKGSICDLKACDLATRNIDYVLHQAALGSVPRSIEDPVTSTSVNILGFVNMLHFSRKNKIKRFVYAASSSTYGDSKSLPKFEHIIGNPLSPYAITKYANELYASNFSKIYGLETIGLRYFNVFGRKQEPDGPYAAVIPKFIKLMINNESPTINGDGSISRDFTYIDNILLINELALLTENKNALNNVFNAACGKRTTLNEMFNLLKELLKDFNNDISSIYPIYGKERKGDVQHSLASIEKANKLLGYTPSHNFNEGMKESIEWYWKNLK